MPPKEKYTAEFREQATRFALEKIEPDESEWDALSGPVDTSRTTCPAI